ncbi:MAG: carboxypeptidase regulatory-like domain-containing protein [Bacteroidetes bacterium]|nr:carboxypeptidase regulatory-like domain-containing protein [Bacteroidota bacterium]
MLKRILFLFLTAFLVGSSLSAQITTSAIGGTVKSTTDEALTGATIVATHVPSGTKYVTVTRPGGVFSIQNMRVGGPYLIEITFVGYKTEKIEDVYLQLAESFQLTPVLSKNEGTMETVVITGTSRKNNILNANRTGAVTNVGKREITVLPSISRSINDLSRLTPQANGAAVGGGNSRQNNITVDGSDFNNTFGIGANVPAQGSPISLDALEEISVNITPFDVRQSGFIGSALNAVTRSGTNQISGSVYTYWRNEKLQGDKVEKLTFARQKLQFNQYGFRVGGPIIKNKLFYFFNFESEKVITPGQTKIAATAGSPFGSGPNVARPTATELNDISSFLLSKYGYNTGAYQGYDLEGDKTKILARLDWNISPKNKLSLRYNQVESSDPAFLSTSFGSTGIVAPAFGTGRSEATALNSLHFQNSNYFQDYNFYSIAAELNTSFSSRISNTFRASYNNQNEPRSSNSSEFPFVDIYKDGSPFTSFGYEPFTFGNLRDVKIYSFVDNLTMSFGKHNILMGIQADFTKTINGFQPLGASYYRFNSWADFVNGVKPNDFAYTYSLKKDYSQAFPGFKFAQYSAFIQDEISVSKRFKLTVGLRADQSTYPGVEEVKENPLVSALTFADGKKVNTGKLPAQKILFSPRVGFNWDLYGDRSLQIRGGTGIFTGRVPFVWIVGQAGNSGMLQITQSFNGTANTPGVFSPNIGTYRPATPPAAGTTMPSTVTVFDENFKMPQTWKTSLAIDVKLPLGLIGTLEAIYNRDYNVIYSKNINLAAPSALNVNGYPDNRLIYPNANAQKFINKLISAGNGILIPSAVGTTAFNMINTGNEKRGHYASITARIEKQFKKGFAAMVSYTKSMANRLYDGQGDQPFNTWSLVNAVNGANNPNLSYASDVVPDRVIASLSYRKEYLKHLATNISFFYEGAIGGRFTYLYSGDFNRDGTSADPIYIPRNASEITFQTQTVNGVTYTPQMQSDLFFAYVEQDKYLRAHKGQYAERNGAQIPWRNQVDMRILQDLFINVGKSKNTIQFSWDVFNIGNLINPGWGKIKTVNNAAILVPRNQANLVPGGTVRPEFNLALDRGQIITRTFRDNVSTASTYYMQFGLRYLFN